MAVGDMRYKFTDKNGVAQEIDIPAEVLRKGKRQGLSNRQTMMAYAADHGFDVDAPATPNKPKRKVTRKPDDQKRMIIEMVAAALEDTVSVNVVNPERQVQVDINGDLFEITLVKKRKPKV